MKLILLVSFLLLFIGCKKYKLNDEQKLWTGDFEWGFSTNLNNESISQNGYSDKYGIRINENSKVYVFKNGDIIYKGVITNIEFNYTQKYIINTESNSEFIDFSYYDGVISSKNWPIKNNDNYYFK